MSLSAEGIRLSANDLLKLGAALAESETFCAYSAVYMDEIVHEKGNRTLWRSQGAFFGIYNVYYKYYNQFLVLTDEEVTVYNVFRSAENGICFWKTKDNIEN